MGIRTYTIIPSISMHKRRHSILKYDVRHNQVSELYHWILNVHRVLVCSFLLATVWFYLSISMQLDVVFDHNSSGDLQHPSKIDFRHIDHLRQIFDVLSISSDEKNRKLFQNVYKNSTNNVKTFIAKNWSTKTARCKFDLLNSIRF